MSLPFDSPQRSSSGQCIISPEEPSCPVHPQCSPGEVMTSCARPAKGRTAGLRIRFIIVLKGF